MPAVPPPTGNFAVLGVSSTDWNGSPIVLDVNNSATMQQTPTGSMIFGFQNVSMQNNAGKLALTSGGAQPRFLSAPALIQQPQILSHNWGGNNLNITNISTNTNTPIWIEAFGPGIGPAPSPLPIGTSVPVSQNETLQGTTNPNWMQISFQFNSSELAVFGIIGGPADASGNNAYVIAVNSPAGNTGPGGATPPAGYYATAVGNNYSFEFNWGKSVIFVGYFGSANVIPPFIGIEVPAGPIPLVTLISL